MSFACPPRTAVKPAWRTPARIFGGALIVVAIVAATMAFLDVRLIELARLAPRWLNDAFNELTDFGQAQWILIPAGLALAGIAALASPRLTHASRLVLAALAVRVGFVFAAVALPGLFVTIVKRLIGRARPPYSGEINPFLYKLFVWRPEFASLPSGHATNVFAALVAVGAVWPRLRPLMWAYALIIAVSRVVIQAHYPSDVIAGAVAGALGALLVRDWFAARRLGFAIGADGRVRALPGPSWRRIKRVARKRLAP